MRRRHILDEARIWRKKKTLTVAHGAERSGEAEETEETESRSEGASQLAHTSPLERPREGKRGPVLATCYYIRGPKYACIIHVHTWALERERTNATACRWINSHGPDHENDDGKLVYVRRKSIYDPTGYTCLSLFLSAYLRKQYRTISTIDLAVKETFLPRARKVRVVDCDELYDGA